MATLEAKKKNVHPIQFERKDNYLYLTIPHHNLKAGMVTMDIKNDSPMYSTMQNGLDFEVVNQHIIKMYQEGKDISVKSPNILIRIYEDKNMVKPFIYKSTDYGKTWKSKEIRGAAFSHGMVWTRDIIHLGNGILYMNFAGDENTPDYECAMFLKSTDYGETWKITSDIVGNENTKLNAIYRSIVDVDGSIIAGAQNYGRILKFE
ncbi:MAG: exo-alpha-sialidase [Clostridia bacterium]|nr:exo-alpha-sialidase [Clostridia bacterium]